MGNIKHGLTHHPLYRRWIRMKQRCFNKNDKNYQWYGGRGITIYKPWIKSAKLFIDYITTLPNCGEPGMTLDRIDNDGDYKPGNLRWTTQRIQNFNKRGGSSSKSVGIRLDRISNRWVSYINITIGDYMTEEEAVKVRKKYIIDNNLSGLLQ